MENLEFCKFTGAGNDFIMIDGFKLTDDEIQNIIELTPQLCARATGIGADGLIIILKHDEFDFQMRYFNSDGSEAEMCGNGGRCAVRFAHMLKYAGEHITFNAESGIYKASIIGKEVRLQMHNPDLPERVNIIRNNLTIKGYFINTGVPHYVLFKSDNPVLKPDQITDWGKFIRYHTRFEPNGTNVNWVENIDDHNLVIRTYERGVEDETLACGTGSTAAGVTAVFTGKTKSPVELKTKSGLILEVELKLEDNSVKDVYLTGEARFVYSGVLKEI